LEAQEFHNKDPTNEAKIRELDHMSWNSSLAEAGALLAQDSEKLILPIAFRMPLQRLAGSF
jgi:hypothetical protein